VREHDRHATDDVTDVRGVYAGVLLVSTRSAAAATRADAHLSFTLWYHFAYVTIGVALLSYGASGSAVAVVPSLARGAPGTAARNRRIRDE
jgi:hypothetical protein